MNRHTASTLRPGQLLTVVTKAALWTVGSSQFYDRVWVPQNTIVVFLHHLSSDYLVVVDDSGRVGEVGISGVEKCKLSPSVID